MEKLKKSLEKIDPEARKRLISLSGIAPNASSNTLLDSILSITGFAGILRSLSREEITLVSLIAESNGLQFSDLEKRASFGDSSRLDELLAHLESHLILYINKNRKHLNNRFDKIYIHTPLIEMIERYLQSPAEAIRSIRNDISSVSPAQVRDKNNFLQTIYEHGGIVALTVAEEQFGSSLNDLIDSFSKKGLCRFILQLGYPFSAFIVLEAQTLSYFFEKEKKKNIALSVNNRYLLLNNINYCHDIISSFGFFLTQQSSFRKNDFKRLSDAVTPIKNFEGRQISNDETALFALYCMNQLGMIVVEKQIIFSDITPISGFFETPEHTTQKLLESFQNTDNTGLFSPPLSVPDNETPLVLLNKMKDGPTNCEVLLHEFVLEQYESWFAQNETLTHLPDYMKYSADLLTWLAILGLIRREGTQIMLSDQGKQLIFSAVSEVEDQSITSKELYINPDFTLLLQENEINDRLHYLLLNFCEIVQMDVMMQVKVTRESVSRAYKRGMNPDQLIGELERHSKNPVPQNLVFLVHEWVRQTVTVSLFFGAIIEVNASSFLDNLEFHKSGKKILVSRISDTIAVVNVENLDEITRLARKHNALVSIKLA